jgi:hypothetical protein
MAVFPKIDFHPTTIARTVPATDSRTQNAGKLRHQHEDMPAQSAKYNKEFAGAFLSTIGVIHDNPEGRYRIRNCDK